MSDREALTPRVFLARHGETEWAKNGRYTGKTDIALTEAGIAQVTNTRTMLVGRGKLIDPDRLVHTFVSPRKRAQQTASLLFPTPAPDEVSSTTEDIAEWDYGDYEGLKTAEIRALRKSRGLDQTQEWDIWRDGCEGGESPQDITTRLDNLIASIRAIQKPAIDGSRPADIILVAHGHILRCFAKRWLGFPLEFSFQMILPPGGVAVMSYKNSNIEEPAFYLGLALPSPDDVGA